MHQPWNKNHPDMGKTNLFLMACILLNALMFNSLYAQTVCYRYGGDDVEYAYQLIEDPNGNFLITGRSHSFTGNPTPQFADIFTVKMDATFNILWTSVFQTPEEDEGNAITNGHGGGYLVAGSSYIATRERDITLLKLDTTGQVQWAKLLGTPLNDNATTIKPLSDNNYVIGGYSDSAFSGLATSFVPFLAKINDQGSVLWARRFGFSSGVFSGSVYDIVEAPDGSLVVTGDIIRLFDGPDDSDLFIARFSSSGNLLWFKWMGLNCPGCQEMGAALIKDGPQRFTVFGSQSTSGSIFICSFDLTGNILLESGLPTGTFAYSTIDAVKANANLTVFTCPAYNNIFVAAIDTLHQVVWSSTYGDVQGSFPCSVIKRGTGYVLGGQSGWADPYREDYLVAVLDSMGYSCCMIGEQPLSTGQLSLTDSTGGVSAPFTLHTYLAGQTATGGVQRLVCSDPSAMKEITSPMVSLWPNPCSAHFRVTFSDHLQHEIRVYDPLGRLIFVSKAMESFQVRTDEWPVGVYALHVDGIFAKSLVRTK